MGKTRGHGSRRGAYRGGRGSKGRGGEDDEDSDEEQYEQARGLGGQRSNVGMLPPSDSEEDEGEEGSGADGNDNAKAGSKAASSSKGGQSKNAGKLPPSDSEDEDEDESEEESSEEPLNEYLSSSAPRRKKQVEEEPDPEQIRKDLERLELIKKKREDDRLKRIADEGWDRFAPISETNKPPGHVPSDHPSQKE